MLDRFVHHNARRLGEKCAFRSLSRELSFARLDASVSRIARSLSGLQKLAPRLVAVQAVDTWRHWMLILALGRLGLATASLPGEGRLEEICALMAPDLFVLYGSGLAETSLGQAENSLVLDDAWFERVLHGVEHDRPEDVLPLASVKPTELCRVAIAAGTGREMRCIGYDVRTIEAFLLRLIYQDSGQTLALLEGQGSLPDVLCTIAPASMSGFLMAGAALAAGMTVCLTDHQNIGAEVSRTRGLIAALTPTHLDHLLHSLPPGMAPLPHLCLSVVGAFLPEGILKRTQQHLTPHVQIVYGTDEAGPIAYSAADQREAETSVGHAMPWVDLQVVDEENRLLPRGTTGIIRVRTGGPEAWYAAPEGDQGFREGWFYPGDRGFVSERGELHLSGRVDDLVALGGSKFDLAVIDRMAREESVVKDAGAFVVPDAEGLPRLYCAFVTDGTLDGEGFITRLHACYHDLPPLTAVWVGEIPRTEAGHVDRDRLVRSLGAYLRQH